MTPALNAEKRERAYRYCEWLTAHHYENFPVASWLLPRKMRPHVAAVYAFARAADDFADEERHRGRSLELLGRWREALWASCNSVPGTGMVPGTELTPHPIFLALAQTVKEYHLPVQWLDDLLTAFTMDVTKRRYANWEELLTYCRYSAHPVGRLVLALFGIQDPELQRFSDNLCSGLQMANHWQDLRIDLARDILYIPKELMDPYGVTESELWARLPAAGPAAGSCRPLPCSDDPRPFPASPAAEERFRRLMAELVARARILFDEGEPLIGRVSGGLRWELKWTLLGGRAILDRIEAAGYDVFRHRPVLSTLDKIGLLLRTSVPNPCSGDRRLASLGRPSEAAFALSSAALKNRAARPVDVLRRLSPSQGFQREAFRYCRWLTRQAGSHFSLSFALLSPERRAGMEVLYAYCRAIDDVVDEKTEDRGQGTGDRRREELNRWRRELKACAEGFPTHPIAVALQSVQSTYNIPWEYFEKLITGVEMDLGQRRYGTFEELKVYCEHVASVVGLISVRVFGCRHPDADRYAADLGIALQLTNILRDLKTDAQRGRVYLPVEDLERFGVTEAELLRAGFKTSSSRKRGSKSDSRFRGNDKGVLKRALDLSVRMTGELSDKFRKLMVFECARAWSYFRQAEEHCQESGEARALRPARMMSAVYGKLLAEIERQPQEAFTRRIRVPKWEQLRIALPFVLSPSINSGQALSKHERMKQPVHPSTGSG